MKKLLVVLVAGMMIFGAAKSHALMNVYGEYLSSVAGGVGGGVNFGMVKAGVHFSGLGLSFGGGVNFPIMAPIMDGKLTPCLDAQFHYALSWGIWSIPVGVTVDYKINDQMTAYGGGGVDVYSWGNLWAGWAGLPAIGVGASFQGGVKYGF